MCTNTTIDDLFKGRPDALLLAFDKLLIAVIDWEPCSVGSSTKSIVFTKEKAWMIVRPMTKQLDVKFYYPEVIQHRLIFKTMSYPKKIAHHIRIEREDQIDMELLSLLRKGYEVG